MKFKKGKYDILIETATTRFENGGIMSGDLVRIRKDALKNEKVKGFTAQFLKMLENAMNTDLNLRAGAVKSTRPTTSGNYKGGTDSPADYYVDIVVEYAPGLWRDPMTVPIEILEVIDTGINLPPVPDSLKRKNKVDMPKKVESPDANRTTPTKNTKPEFENKTTDGRIQIKKPNEVSRKNLGKLTLEDVYGDMLGTDPSGAGTTDDDGRFVGYTVKFGEPYGKNPDAIIDKIQGMPSLSNNMDAKFVDDNTLELKIDGDLDPAELEKMITNVTKGTVSVTKTENDMTSFGAPAKTGSTLQSKLGNPVSIASGSQAIGA